MKKLKKAVPCLGYMESYRHILGMGFREVSTQVQSDHGTIMFKRRRAKYDYSETAIKKWNKKYHLPMSEEEINECFDKWPNKTWVYGVYANGYIRKCTSLHNKGGTCSYKPEYRYWLPFGRKNPNRFIWGDYDNAFKWIIDNINRSRVK